MFLAIYPDNIKIGEGLLIAIAAIIMVFIVLLLIIFCVNGLSIFCKNIKETQPVKNTVKKVNKMTDIKDEDMMVAALIATIDYSSETGKDVRLVSIKQIG